MNATSERICSFIQGGIGYGANTGSAIGSVTELIRKRAYEFFEERGREPGQDLEDWLQAELEIKRRLGLWLL
jgi:Protein of unknown function (DUF2934)